MANPIKDYTREEASPLNGEVRTDIVALDVAWEGKKGQGPFIVRYISYMDEQQFQSLYDVEKVNATRRRLVCRNCYYTTIQSSISDAAVWAHHHTRDHHNRQGPPYQGKLPEVLRSEVPKDVEVLNLEGRQYSERILEAAESYRVAVLEQMQVYADRRDKTPGEDNTDMGYRVVHVDSQVQNTRATLLNAILAGGEE